jgi:PhnB protein
MAVKPIPDGLDGATPYLCIRGAQDAIDFYKKAFGAREVMRIDQGGKVGHAELMIGNARIYLADEFPTLGFVSPQTLGGSPIMIQIYVDDIDAFAKRAVAAGATLVRPVEDQFYGDRGGQIDDPFGHRWWFATHVEDVSNEEMKRRSEKKKQ